MGEILLKYTPKRMVKKIILYERAPDILQQILTIIYNYSISYHTNFVSKFRWTVNY